MVDVPPTSSEVMVPRTLEVVNLSQTLVKATRLSSAATGSLAVLQSPMQRLMRMMRHTIQKTMSELITLAEAGKDRLSALIAFAFNATLSI